MTLGHAETTAPTLDANVSSHPDGLGREGFAKELLKVIRLLPAEGGAVVGLEGEWGAGKTWVLEHLRKLNEVDGEPVLLVRFNPWMVSGSAEIVETFLIQLASELALTDRPSSRQKGAEIASKIIEFTRVLSTVKHLAPMANLLLPGSGLVLEGVAEAAGTAASAAKDMAGSTLDHLKKSPGKLSLNAAREAVMILLRKADRRIAVLVDDLDRLPPAELAAMVQAVKAVADFPNVIYVLAYDPETAAHALEAALRLRECEGRRYLEKIVQFPMPVPEVPAFKMQRFAESRLQEALGKVEAEDEQDILAALPRAAALMRLPRDVLRLQTRLLLQAGRLVKEISPADLLLVEALNLKAPHVIEHVQAHASDMLRSSAGVDGAALIRGQFTDEDDAGLEQHKESPAGRLETRWKMHRKAIDGAEADASQKKVVRQAVAYLFDAVPEDFRFNEPHHASRRRIQNVRNWLRWRAVVRHGEVFENSEVWEWLRRPQQVTSSPAWNNFESFHSFCSLASDQAAKGVDAVAFVDLFAQAVEKFDDDRLRYGKRFGPQHAMVEVIRADPGNAALAVERLIDSCSVWFSEHVVWVVCTQTLGTRGHSPESGRHPLVKDADAAKRLIQRWLDKAWDWLRGTPEPHPHEAAFTLACWMFQMGADADPLRNELTRIATTFEHGLEVCFGGTAYTDTPRQQFPLQGYLMDLLPDPVILKPVLDRQPEFCKDHQWLVSRSSDSSFSPAPDAPAPAPSP